MLLKDSENSDSKCNRVQGLNLPPELYSENESVSGISSLNGVSSNTNDASIVNGVSSVVNDVSSTTNGVSTVIVPSTACRIIQQAQANGQCKISYAAALKDNTKVNGTKSPVKNQPKENGVTSKSSSPCISDNQNGLQKQAIKVDLGSNYTIGVPDCPSNQIVNKSNVAATTSNSANRSCKSTKKNKGKAHEKNSMWPIEASSKTSEKDNTLCISDNKNVLSKEFSHLTVNDSSTHLQQTTSVSRTHNIDLNFRATSPTSSDLQTNSVSFVQSINALQSSKFGNELNQIESSEIVESSQNDIDFQTMAKIAMSSAVVTCGDITPVTVIKQYLHKSEMCKQAEDSDSEAAKECDTKDESADPCTTPESGRVSETPSETETLQIDINEHLSYGDNLEAAGGQDMLSSPVTSYCDSVDSNDSGRGGSVLGNESRMGYDFLLAAKYCGVLIGKKGSHVNRIKDATDVVVLIRPYPWVPETKIVSLFGEEQKIEKALKLIRRRFDPIHYPDVTLERVSDLYNGGIVCPPSLSLTLPEGVEFPVVISATITAGHFFVQLPTHDSFYALPPFNMSMMSLYTQRDSPLVTNPAVGNVVAVSAAYNGWYRAEIMEIFKEDETCRVKYLDYGGYCIVPLNNLRQINIDCMHMPFQSIECYLANVACHDELGWTVESKMAFDDMAAHGKVLSAFVAGVAANGIPCLHLYNIAGATNTFINQALVETGFLKWISYDNVVTPAEVTENEVTEA